MINNRNVFTHTIYTGSISSITGFWTYARHLHTISSQPVSCILCTSITASFLAKILVKKKHKNVCNGSVEASITSNGYNLFLQHHFFNVIMTGFKYCASSCFPRECHKAIIQISQRVTSLVCDKLLSLRSCYVLEWKLPMLHFPW